MDPEFLLRNLGFGVVLPALIAAAGLWPALWLRHQPRWALSLAPFALGLAYLVSAWALWGFKGWWPPALADRNVLIIAGIGVVLAAISWLPRAWAAACIPVLATLALLPAAVRTDEARHALWWLLPLTVLILSAGIAGSVALQRRQPRTANIVHGAWLGFFVAPLFAQLASTGYAQAAGMVAALWAAVAALMLWRGQTVEILPAFSVLAAGALLYAQSVLGISHPALWLMAAAPAAGLLTLVVRPERLVLRLFCNALPLLIAAAAIAWTLVPQHVETEESSGPDYGSVYGS